MCARKKSESKRKMCQTHRVSHQTIFSQFSLFWWILCVRWKMWPLKFRWCSWCYVQNGNSIGIGSRLMAPCHDLFKWTLNTLISFYVCTHKPYISIYTYEYTTPYTKWMPLENACAFCCALLDCCALCIQHIYTHQRRVCIYRNHRLAHVAFDTQLARFGSLGVPYSWWFCHFFVSRKIVRSHSPG